jgi:hypothetical protein
MENTIIKEVEKKGLDTYFKARQYEAMFWPTLFPLQNVLNLNFTTLIGEQNGRVAADIIAYDASAPEKTRQIVSKMRGDIPKIAIKRKMSETNMLEYLMLSRMSDPNEQQIIDLVFNDVDFVVQAVNARMEWLALQAASTTKISLSTSNNGGIVTEEAVDFQMPTANKKACSVIWTASAATTKPITDIKAVSKAARAKGHPLASILMHPDTFDYFVLSEETQAWLKGFFKIESTDVLPFEDLASINRALATARLPQIIIIDTAVGIETKAGVISYVNPWSTDFVTFVPTTQFGNMLNGPIAEELKPPKQVTQSKAGNVLVSKFSLIDPLAEFTKGEANCFPAWKNIDVCYSLRVTNVSWGG